MESRIKSAETPWVTPYMTVADVDKAIEFYVKAFHFEVRDSSTGKDGKTLYAELIYMGQLIALVKEGFWSGSVETPANSSTASPVTLYVYTENVDDLFEHAIDNGAMEKSIPTDMLWGDRMCQVIDPDGYLWAFATRIATPA